MDRIGKPRGLVAYMALSDEIAEREGKEPKSIWKHVLRPRTILYTTIWSAIGIGLIVLLFIRTDLDMSVAPVRNPTHVVLSDGTVRNIYDVRLRNMNHEARVFYLSVTDNPDLSLSIEGVPGKFVTVAPDEQALLRVYLTAPNGSTAASAERTTLRLWANLDGGQTRVYSDTVFNGRGQ
jgi:polyferredoxin